jgi:hypothetical protein
MLRFQMETKALLSGGLEATLATPWKRHGLDFVRALRLCRRLSLKVMD